MSRRVATVILLGLAAACSADSPTVSSTHSVALAVEPIAMLAGDSIVPSVMVTVDGVARVPNSREIIVTSSDTSVVMVAPNGALLAVGDGSAEIRVAWAATPSISANRPVAVLSENLTGVVLLAPPTMIPGDSAQFVVTGTIRGGRRVSQPVSVTVTSRNPAVVTASGNRAVALAPGTAWVVADASTGVSDSSFVTVAAGPPAGLVLSPRATSLVVGQIVVLSAAMVDRRGNVVTGMTPAYTTSAPAVATVQSDGTLTAVGAGDAMIVATAGAAADTLRLSVTAPIAVLGRLVVSPDSVTLNPGGATPIQVQALDGQGRPMAPPALTWQSQTAGVTVSSAGVIQAAPTITGSITNGSVRVSSGSIQAMVRVAVLVPAVTARLVVTPDSVTLIPGGTAVISVQALDGQGRPVALPALTWQSQTSGVTVSSAGVIQAAASISTTISAGAVQVSSGSISAQVRVVVVVAPPPPPPDNGFVQIRWVGVPPSPAVAAAFEAARQRLNGLFMSFNGVAAINPTSPADYCMAGSPALNETVNGIVIFAQVTPIDGVGNILGSAGPCLVRDITWLPVVGAMHFDVADMDAMIANGKLNGVVLHEMMHTLGFGTIWGPGAQNQVASPSGTDPRYLGARGQSEYAALGAVDAPSGVPVENTGGSGTRGSHWRESVFHSELMTGWADGALQMSRVTIGALKDFGYDVDLGRADPFVLTAGIVGSTLRAPLQQLQEQTTRPIGVVGGNGRITPFAGTMPR